MRPRTLTNKEIVLAPITIETAKAFPLWLDDLEVAKFLGHFHHIPDQNQEEEWYKKVVESPTDYVWEIKFQDKVVGISGIHQIDWVNRYAITGTIIGDKSVWGKGLGTKTMILRAQFAFGDLDLRILETHAFTANLGSMKATKKCGYEVVGVIPNRFSRQGQRWEMTIKILTAKRFRELNLPT